MRGGWPVHQCPSSLLDSVRTFVSQILFERIAYTPAAASARLIGVRGVGNGVGRTEINAESTGTTRNSLAPLSQLRRAP